MNGREVLRIVDAIHRDKNIDKEIVFEGIEQAILSAARKHFGEEHELAAHIDRETGEPSVICDGKEIEPDVLGEILGRIAAQTAKQVMIQKIREAERDALYNEYSALRGHIVTGTIKRIERGSRTAYVDLGKVEAILPAGEQIPGETHRVGERVRAIIIDVKKSGSRVKVILSRTHPEFIVRLFEMEIPEVAEGIIEIKSLAREAGHRTKVAVSCYDPNVDCVGACVGVRGSRIKSIVDELHGERVDIVRWNDSLQVLVPNAMQPAEVEDVILCPMLGRVIVLVREDQLSQAIGKRGQNVRLASKLVGWDIEVMTRDELDEQLDRSVAAFASIPGVSEELAENLVAQGFFSFYDLSVIEPEDLAELGGLTPEECDRIIEYADREAMRQEEEEAKRRAEEKEAARQEAKAAAAAEAGATTEGEAGQAEAAAVGSTEAAASDSATEAQGGAAGAVEEETVGSSAETSGETAGAAQAPPETPAQAAAVATEEEASPASAPPAEAETAAEAPQQDTAELEAQAEPPGQGPPTDVAGGEAESPATEEPSVAAESLVTEGPPGEVSSAERTEAPIGGPADGVEPSAAQAEGQFEAAGAGERDVAERDIEVLPELGSQESATAEERQGGSAPEATSDTQVVESPSPEDESSAANEPSEAVPSGVEHATSSSVQTDVPDAPADASSPAGPAETSSQSASDSGSVTPESTDQATEQTSVCTEEERSEVNDGEGSAGQEAAG